MESMIVMVGLALVMAAMAIVVTRSDNGNRKR